MPQLTERDWRAREAAHHARVDALTAGHLERRNRAEQHPVIDFLFDYYGHTPAKLRRWHPGAGIRLEAAAGDARAAWTHMRTGGEDVTLDVNGYLEARGRAVRFIGELLTRTLARPALTGCFGLHEWAMIYRQPGARRHPSWPLRLGPAGTDAVLEAGTLRCTHFDATRFFTPDAVPRNALSPTRETQLRDEQPGCLHAGMDLYRWCFKLAPALSSDLTVDAFELAVELRTLDMQASPYDFRALGYEPVAIETPDGRREYAERQRAFAARGNALRVRLLDALTALQRTPALVGE
jgi:hypothetical protein